MSRQPGKRYSDLSMRWNGSTKKSLETQGTFGQPASDHWLLAPVNSLTGQARWLLLSAFTTLVVLWSALRSGNLTFWSGLPDVLFYVNTAYGRYDLVPQPFSSRPLAPLVARLIALSVPCSIERGFVLLAYLSLLWTFAIVFWLLLRSGAPRWFLLAVAAVPFWPGLLYFDGLPDPLYAALLATLLLMLECGWLLPAAALMLPLMVARESTWLTLLCLLAVASRRLRWAGCALAAGCAVLGAFLVRRFTAAGLPNPEHLSGAMYMAGKLGANLLRTFGVLPWSNVYPVLCEAPVWQARVHLGAVRSVGVCSWDSGAPLQAVWALLTTFGVLPLFLLPLWRRRRLDFLEQGTLVRFSVLYGGASLLLAPALGTWYDRLFAYGWPLLLVAVPRLTGAGSETREQAPNSLPWWGSLMVVHLLLCAQGNRGDRPSAVIAVVALQAVAVALFLGQPRMPGAAVRPL